MSRASDIIIMEAVPSGHVKEYEQEAEKSPDPDSGHHRTSGGTAFYPGGRICENGIVHDPISGDRI